MRGSFKTRLRAKRTRQKMKRKKNVFKFAIHEVGHYVIRKSFYPQELLEIRVSSKGGRLYGTVSLQGRPIQDDHPRIRLATSVAGVVAEKLNISQPNQIQESFFNYSAGKGDKLIFIEAKHDLKKIRHNLSFETVQSAFDIQVAEAKSKFEKFGWSKMIELAKLVREKRFVVA